MNLNELLKAGCDLNAGYLDHYDAQAHKHTRVAQVTVGGDVIPTLAGEVFIAKLRASAAPPPTEPDFAEVVVTTPKTPKKPKGGAAAQPEDLALDLAGLE